MYYAVVMALAIAFSFLGSSVVVKAQDFIERVTYRQAVQTDVPSLLELINTQAISDSSKIVILPKLFREEALSRAIDKKRLFVAVLDGKVIGFKKLFCITDKQELEEILTQELRCTVRPVNEGLIAESSQRTYTFADSMPCTYVQESQRSTYIYDGGDFTHPDYRGHGVNTYLTECAFSEITQSVVADIIDRQSQQLVIAYGLTHTNAGDTFLSGRTMSIVRCFGEFVRTIATFLATTEGAHVEDFLIGSRYQAFMPTFDPDSSECRPLPDERSIPGYGYLLTALLQYGSYNAIDGKFS